MKQEFSFGKVTVVFDTESLPIEYLSVYGVRIIRPGLTYEERMNAYTEIREAASRAIYEWGGAEG